MNRVKSTLEDEQILADEAADPVERGSSARKLLSDGYFDTAFPILAQWFDHPESTLREDAISLLLGSLGHQKYVGKVIEMLHTDSSDFVRGDAANSLSNFCVDFVEGEKYEEQIIKELLVGLLKDEDSFVQKHCYNGLYKIIKKERWKLYDEIDYFDRNRDVDWNLLQPYLEKYGLQKPD